MERVIKIESVRTFDTRGGNKRYVVRDSDGSEYTTFREAIGGKAAQSEGQRARIEFHEEQRGQYQNVYLDAVEGLPDEPASGGEDTDPQEAAWRTAVEAAPWLVGKPEGEVDPEELYEKLKPFEERVAADIEDGRQE